MIRIVKRNQKGLYIHYGPCHVKPIGSTIVKEKDSVDMIPSIHNNEFVIVIGDTHEIWRCMSKWRISHDEKGWNKQQSKSFNDKYNYVNLRRE